MDLWSTLAISVNPTRLKEYVMHHGEAYLRDDDKPGTRSKNRLSVYHEQTQPLIEYYSGKSVLKKLMVHSLWMMYLLQ